MKFLLVAINAKYIHSNPAVFSLKAYAKDFNDSIAISEYTINHNIDDIFKDIYKQHPDVIGFSCYIWNINYIENLITDLHKILPNIPIWLGGPEVSFDANKRLEKFPFLKGIMIGEGEHSFKDLMNHYVTGNIPLSKIKSITYRNEAHKICINPILAVMNMSDIPFIYENLANSSSHDKISKSDSILQNNNNQISASKDSAPTCSENLLPAFKNRIIYYESSRGCPFNCSYCLSSVDKQVRFRDLSLVLEELAFFLKQEVPQVKFVDRTFNCKKSHEMGIWKFLLENDNNITNFHFEISADLIKDEELALLSKFRPGYIQLEIGVQSTNPDTIRAINRNANFEEISKVVRQINSFHNIHQHLDLIAGLPYEDYNRFQISFNDVYDLAPEQLQLGFLKVLKGSSMYEKASEYGIVYKENPPYEVLYTNWMSYDDILKLKDIEEMVEVYYNSGQFRITLQYLVKQFSRPFNMYEALAKYYVNNYLFNCSHSRIARYNILLDFTKEYFPDKINCFKALLIYDLYLRENIKTRPDFAISQSEYKDTIRNFFDIESKKHQYLKADYEGYNSKQLMHMSHLEIFNINIANLLDDKIPKNQQYQMTEYKVLFDYKHRNPLTYDAATYIID